MIQLLEDREDFSDFKKEIIELGCQYGNQLIYRLNSELFVLHSVLFFIK